MMGNININSNPGYGYTLTRTSYDVRQEINAKVIGVLRYNNAIREKLLKRNIGSYGMLDSEQFIGYIPNPFSLESSNPTSLGEDGLLGYTHIVKSDYQEEIRNRYGFLENSIIYESHPYGIFNHWRWNGQYNDYTEYINDIYGLPVNALSLLGNLFSKDKLQNISKEDYNYEKSLTIRSVLNDFLQYDNIKYAMEQNRVGTIRPNPLAALAGAVTTNINNFSGKDTSLGLISNHLYAHTLLNGAQFNTIRKTPYITEKVYDSIGNKLSTISTLDSDFRIDPDTGRLAYEFGEGIGTASYESLTFDDFEDIDMIDNTRDIANSRNARFRNLFRNINYYAPFDGYQYEIPDETILLYSLQNGYKNAKFIRSWNEGDKGNWSENIFYGIDDNAYVSLEEKDLKDPLIKRTQDLFRRHDEKGIDTLVGRFHTSGGRDVKHNEISLLQTAVSKYGMSHGRNLLHKQAYENGYAGKTNGYENPYCRVWTYHHQYDKVNKLMRPFSTVDSNGVATITGVDDLQHNWWMYGRRAGSATRLRDNSALNRNGFVNITPAISTDEQTQSVDIKKCMFSIENLAWKDTSPTTDNQGTRLRDSLHGPLTDEQRGPNGGRIMWFPPYDLKFNEQVGVNWNPVEFIGRGEKIYTYTNTERSGTLSFILLVDHPSILDMWKKNGATGKEENDEQKLLRFFAGCDVLELDNVQVKTDEEVADQNVVPYEKTPYVETEKTEDIVFYVFFPNNYSGIDDLDGATRYSDMHFNRVLDYLTDVYESNEMGSSNGSEIYEGYKWQYRVDNKYLTQKLIESNYSDNEGYALNTNIEMVHLDNNFQDATHTLNEIYGDLYGIIGETGQKIKKITVKGFASEHGYEDINIQQLAQKRTEVIGQWIEKKLSNKFGFEKEVMKTENGGQVNVDEIDKNNVSGESAKRARCVKVIISVSRREMIEDLSQITIPVTNNSAVTTVNQTLNRTIEINTTNLTKAQKRAIRKNERQVKKNIKENLKNGVAETILQERTNVLNKKIREESLASTFQINENFDLRKPAAKVLSATQLSDTRKSVKQVRWDEESQYFEMLKDNDSFLYNKIIDKIKYFTPAFHSITPEGFNARLSFLHQCTRQGQTLGTSDYTAQKSAGNMAFGRPPICVLRIGDFYHTRIIINSITIDYDTQQWDMNPEGIGVQPMLARISLNFVFLGGSDIEAPIARLQNAVSFNYYANQSIYDDRSDIGVYDEQKKKAIIQGTPWIPQYEEGANTNIKD